jgi:subtilisin-like proprotein convertase family protein
MEHLDFSGITRLDPGESLAADGYSFQTRNPVVIDRLLRIGAVAHRHDGHAALADPTAAPTVATTDTGGTLPSDTAIYVCYTLVDQYGGETLATDPQIITTQAGLAAPDDSPTLALDHSAGSLLAGAYYYQITVTDGLGGETSLGPTDVITIDPGYPNSRITVSGLAALVTAAGGAGWRLWRMIDGGPLREVAEGTADSVVDDGSLCPDCSAEPPGTTQETNSTSALRVTVPGGQPAGTVSFNIYAAIDGDFTSPNLLGNYPIADAGSIKTYTSLTLADGSPPSVSLSIPGADKINPDTDMLDFPWKRPVANAGALPSTGNTNGDIRESLDDHVLHAWTGSAWTTVGGGGGGGGGGGTSQFVGRVDQATANLSIPDSGGGNLDIPFVVGAGTVGTIEVSLYMTHAFDSDIDIKLVTPTGTLLNLFNHRGGVDLGTGTADNARTVFSDAGIALANTAPGGNSARVGLFKPEAALKTLRGIDAAGTWKIRFTDIASGDTGVVHASSLVFTAYTAPTGHIVRDEGTALTQRESLNFVGPSVVATDDSANDRTVVTVDGGKMLYGTDTVRFVDGSNVEKASVFGRDSWGSTYTAKVSQDFNLTDAAFPTVSAYTTMFDLLSGSGLKVVAASGELTKSGSGLESVRTKDSTSYNVFGDFIAVVLLNIYDLANVAFLRFGMEYIFGGSPYGLYYNFNHDAPSGWIRPEWSNPTDGGILLAGSDSSRAVNPNPFSSSPNYLVARRKGNKFYCELWKPTEITGGNGPTGPAGGGSPSIREVVTLNANTINNMSDTTALRLRLDYTAAGADKEGIDSLTVYQPSAVSGLWVKVGTQEKLVLNADGSSDFI